MNLNITPGGTCTITHTGDDGQFIDAVAQSYITDPKDDMGFTYGGSQSSSVTVGLSDTNAFGSFTASGTNSITSGAVQPFPYQIGVDNVYWRTYLLWGHFRETCVSKFTSIWWYSQPRAWIVSANVYHPGSGYGWHHCGPEFAGATPSVDHTTATTISDAFNNTFIGFEGGSQTGYSTTASVNYYYGEKGWLCGQYDYTQGGAVGVPTAIP